MAFYHLKILTNSNKYIYKYDLTKEIVVTDYLSKYLSGNPFFVDGYNVSLNNVQQFKIVVTDNDINYTMSLIRQAYHSRGIAVAMNESTIIDNHNYSKEVTNELIKELNNISINSKSLSFSKESKKVFIVHGHDTSLLNEAEAFVRCLDLEPIILFKEADKGKTIIEKIEEYSGQACYSIVLYSSCDVGYPKGEENKVKPRARQNVVFEHGYMMALLGRENVCALLENNDIETPGDINGIVYVPYDINGAWKFRIAKNMKSVGIDIDLNKLL